MHTPIYYLRTTIKGKHAYLRRVSDDGLTAAFDAEPRKGCSFDKLQRDEFKKKHSHITGRWVLMANELRRIEAAKKG
jgi:hypothetical protein